MTQPGCLALLAAVALSCISPAAAGPAVPAGELTLEQLTEVKIRIATGSPKAISQAPAVASVITAAQIEAMGATHLDEVLERIPGLHAVPVQFKSLDPSYVVRGVRSALNAQVLILINGVPITELLQSGPVLGFHLPVVSISRVEVIRGPGSAIYGADAYAGVVNVITKRSEEIATPRIGVGGGSFGTRNVWLEYGGRWGAWDAAITLDGRETDGDDGRRIQVDQQTTFDSLFGTSASLAPGSLSSFRELLDLHVELARPGWTVRLWAWNSDHGLGSGRAQALDPRGVEETRLVLIDAINETTIASERWKLTHRISHLNIDQHATFNLFPPGAVLPIGADGNIDFASPVNQVSFPDGVITRPTAHQRVTSLNHVALYSGNDRHRVRLNTGIEFQDETVGDEKNFGPGVIDGTQTVVDGTLTNVSGTEFTFLPETRRHHWHVSAQDEWLLADRWDLTAGARYDHYSDFGGTLNPRIAVVWRARPGLTTKLLFGSAFRAPSFALLYARNNPSVVGNPDLEPETIDTLEWVLDYRPLPRWHTVLSLYRYRADDLVRLLADPGQTTPSARNSGLQDGYGFEFEMHWKATETLDMEGNYSWQHSEDRRSGARTDGVPRTGFYVGAHWRFRPDWSFFAKIDGVGERTRLASDTRGELGGYTSLDVSLRRSRISTHLDLALTGRNLLDEDGLEPTSLVIPGDFPIPGRAIHAELIFRLH